MRVAVETLALLALSLAACGETLQEGSANNAAATEIEALPPDESVEPPPEEPAGDAEPSTENAAQY